MQVDALDISPFCSPTGLRSQQQEQGGSRGAAASPTYQLIAMSHHSGRVEGGSVIRGLNRERKGDASGRFLSDKQGGWMRF